MKHYLDVCSVQLPHLVSRSLTHKHTHTPRKSCKEFSCGSLSWGLHLIHVVGWFLFNQSIHVWMKICCLYAYNDKSDTERLVFFLFFLFSGHHGWHAGDLCGGFSSEQLWHVKHKAEACYTPDPVDPPLRVRHRFEMKKADHAKGRFASVPLKKTISAFFLFVLLKWKTCLVHFGRTLQLRPYVSEVHSSYKLGRDMQLDELIPRLKADKAKTSAEPSFLLYF